MVNGKWEDAMLEAFLLLFTIHLLLFTSHDHSPFTIHHSPFTSRYLPTVRFILLNSRQDPIKLSRGYLSTAEFTNADRIYLKRRPAIWAIQIGAGRRRFSITVSNKRPILAPLPQAGLRTTNYSPAVIHSVIVALRANPQGYRVVKSVFRDLDRLHRSDAALVEDISQVLALIGINPVLMHLKQVVSFVGARPFPVESGPRGLKLIED